MVLTTATQLLRSEWLNVDPLMAGILIVSCSMKSIVAITYVWLPDAMEGPTSVSALLHSATLVITGILISYHKVAIPSAPVLVGMFILGLVLLAITSDYDPDAKRVAAISTCTIIIVCWLGILTSSPVSWTWAQLHAGYKATLFLGITVFASTFTMQDLRSLLAHPITPYLGLLLVVVLFAIVIPGSDYDLTKHHLKLDIDSDWQLEFLQLH